MERIKKRGRKYECNNITLEYLQDIHELHENSYKNAIENNMDILIIDIEDKEINEIISIIYDYIK